MEGVGDMTKRKFTPPTEFPAEYVNGHGDKITLLARGEGYVSLTGQNEFGNWQTYTESGCRHGFTGVNDLHDIPKKQVSWGNDGPNGVVCWHRSRAEANEHAFQSRIALIRRERVEGELPQYFVEEV
jgi:hypothetical protein